jgi:hypothetical protein
MAEKKSEVAAFVPRTKEEIETALKERKALTTMLVPPAEPAGQAKPGAPPVTYAEPALPPSPPAPVVDTTSISAARQSKLDEIEKKAKAIRALEGELATQEQNAAALIAQMRVERQALVQQREALERDVIAAQQALAAAEAQQLAEKAVTDQASRAYAERLPLNQWREEYKKQITPLIRRTQEGLGRLLSLVKEKGKTLEQVSTLRCPPGLPEQEWSVFRATSIAAGKVLTELHEAIRWHQAVIGQANDFAPTPTSQDGRSEVNAMRRALEDCSGIVTGRLVDLSNPRADRQPHAGTPGDTPSSLELAARVTEILSTYPAIQKRVNSFARPLPTIEITLIPKGESKPRHETMAELRGPKPQQERAAGVPEEN